MGRPRFLDFGVVPINYIDLWRSLIVAAAKLASRNKSARMRSSSFVGLVLSLLLSAPSFLVQGAPTFQRLSLSKPKVHQQQRKHDESVADLIDYFTAHKGVYYNPKQQIRRQDGMMGVFATERIQEGELLCSVPWNATINAGRKVSRPPHLVCDTVHSLVREMKLGNESEFGPYVAYLLNQRVGQLPSAWSEPAKELLRRVLDDGVLPPEEATSILEDDWHWACGGLDDPFENNAAMLVIQRAEDDLMVPVYDFYNHRNGHYLNTVNHRRSQKSFDVTAAKTIEAGEQVYISYNMCSNCGNRANHFGTPGECDIRILYPYIHIAYAIALLLFCPLLLLYPTCISFVPLSFFPPRRNVSRLWICRGDAATLGIPRAFLRIRCS